MQMPHVLILVGNDFHRRLMSDVVECNEMRATASNCDDCLDRVAEGAYRPSVVVVDCDLPGLRGIRAVERLRALPGSRRPRIVGLVRDRKELRATNGSRLQLEEVLETPLDVGSFARTVARQAHAAVLAAEG